MTKVTKEVKVIPVSVEGKKRLRLDFEEDKITLVYVKRFAGVAFYEKGKFWHIPVDTDLRQLQKFHDRLLDFRVAKGKYAGSETKKRRSASVGEKKTPASGSKKAHKKSSVSKETEENNESVTKGFLCLLAGLCGLFLLFYLYHNPVGGMASLLGMVIMVVGTVVGGVLLLSSLVFPTLWVYHSDGNIIRGETEDAAFTGLSLIFFYLFSFRIMGAARYI